MLLGQFAAVALPEEMFFRGYVLGRLRACLRPRHTVLGVPFGWAHVLSALLFAAVHLFAVPEAHRLLVFFPGLLFAWLAERGRTVVAAAVHHTLANATLQLLQRLYG
jgi:membrane protease YdiL (CAAX protease family)